MNYITYFICDQLLFDLYIILLIIWRTRKLEQDTLSALKSLKKYIDSPRHSVDDAMCVDAEEYMKEKLKKYKEEK